MNRRRPAPQRLDLKGIENGDSRKWSNEKLYQGHLPSTFEQIYEQQLFLGIEVDDRLYFAVFRNPF